jgi:hypothetical protein
MKKKIYEIFNMSTGMWEETEMTETEYNRLQDRMDAQADELEAEFQIISRIISQQLGENVQNPKSMD